MFGDKCSGTNVWSQMFCYKCSGTNVSEQMEELTRELKS
jgi:hypothetical protein